MRAAETLDAIATLRDAEAKTQASGLSAWPVRSHEGLIGVTSREAIEFATKSGGGEKRLWEIVPPGEFPHVHADQSLHTALGRMGAAGLDVLPVVSRANVRQPLGIVTVDDVLALYGVRPRRVDLACFRSPRHRRRQILRQRSHLHR